jgi:hypothetical protein
MPVNCAGHMVIIRVNDAITGWSYYNNTAYVPQNRPTAWWRVKNLLKCSYRTGLVMEGTLLQTGEFALDNATPEHQPSAPL